MNENPLREVALIGFGEFGGIFGSDLASAGLRVSVFDILFNSEQSRAAMLAKANDAHVRACDSLEEAIRSADLVISAVTCSAAAEVARNSVQYLGTGQTYLDINSVSPETKREIAQILEPSHAIFIEAAVMAPVSPQRLKVPMLLGGAEKEVLASLAATYPHMGWDGPLPDYLISRVAEHGRRRAAEMREAAETLRNIDLEPLTALATAERQDWLVQEMAERDISVRPGEPFSWQQLADAIAASASEEKLAERARKGA